MRRSSPAISTLALPLKTIEPSKQSRWAEICPARRIAVRLYQANARTIHDVMKIFYAQRPILFPTL